MEPGITGPGPKKEEAEVFNAVSDLAPPDLLEFLEQCASLLPEDTRYRLRQVVDSAGEKGDPLQRVLEICRRQWEGLQYQNDVQVALVGPARTGKSSLLSTITGEDPGQVSSIFRIIDLQGLSEYLGYGLEYGAELELEDVDVVVLVLDASYGFTEDTVRMVQDFARGKHPLLLVLNKIDLVEKPKPLLRQIRRKFRLPVVGVSVREPESVQRILKGIVSVCPRALYSLGRHLPAFRRTICRGIITQASFGSGLVSAFPIPIGDILPISAIQTSMLLKIAKAHGFKINRERVRELLPILAAGGLVREGTQRLREIFPSQGKVISISVAGVWTFLIGQAAVEYFNRLSSSAERVEVPVWESAGI